MVVDLEDQKKAVGMNRQWMMVWLWNMFHPPVTYNEEVIGFIELRNLHRRQAFKEFDIPEFIMTDHGLDAKLQIKKGGDDNNAKQNCEDEI